MSRYGPLAQYYDSLTEDVDYRGLCDYLMGHFARNGIRPGRVLDMACGTGSLSLLLAQSGVETLGMDLSADMLERARDKAAGMPGAPRFYQADMAEFTLERPVDGLVCMLDSFNYLTDPADGVAALRCFYEALAPGGLLIYDVRPRRQLMEFDGQVFLDETDDVLCLWRTEFDREENLCFYGMDIFLREDGLWRREREEHWEYAYRLRWLKARMEELGFLDVRFFGDRRYEAPNRRDARVFITARRGG